MLTDCSHFSYNVSVTQSPILSLDHAAGHPLAHGTQGIASDDALYLLREPARLQWYRPRDRSALADPVVGPLRYVTGRPRRGRYVMAGQVDGRSCLVKVRQLSLRKRVPAWIGRRFMRHEARMLAIVHDQTDLLTPEPYLLGERLAMGMPATQVIAMEIFDDHIDMTRWMDGPPHRREEAMNILVDMLKRIRESGFADADFNGNNVLVDAIATSAADRRPVWIDFERVWISPPSSTRGTAETTAALLGWWWPVCAGDRGLYQSLVDGICDALPTPEGGWKRCMKLADRRIVRRFVRHRRTAATAPPPLAVKAVQ